MTLAVFQKQQDLERAQIQSFLTLMQSYYLRYRIYKRSVDCWGPEQAIILIGRHPHFVTAVDYTQIYARSNHPVLITGETGTGKELFARALHVLKPRSDGSFIPVNCAYLDPQMAHSHLFGHCKGSFTGARGDRKGAFQAAENGTLFLDEVEALSTEVQSMILRALDYGEITPLGADTPKYVKTRIVAATNKNLSHLVKTGHLRRDLYYRLRTHEINLQRLSDRGAMDIRELAWYFLWLENYNHDTNKAFTTKALQLLSTYYWPGNIRELRNSVINAVFFSDNSQKITSTNLQLENKGQPLDSTEVNKDSTTKLFNQLTEEGKDYWEIVHKPYQNRDLNRDQVKSLIERGFETVGSRDLKALSALFGIHKAGWRRFYLLGVLSIREMSFNFG